MQTSARRTGCRRDASGENRLKFRRRQANAGERTQDVFRAFASNHALVSRQEQHRRLVTRGKDERRRAERRDTFETHRTRSFESDDGASANTLSSGTSCQREFRCQRPNTDARRRGLAMNLIEIGKRTAWVGRKGKEPRRAPGREQAATPRTQSLEPRAQSLVPRAPLINSPSCGALHPGA